MRIDQLALLFALVVAANVVLVVALQLPLGRRRRPGANGRAEVGDTGERGRQGTDGEGIASAESGAGLPAPVYQRMARVVSFLFIGAAMAIEVLTGAPNQAAVIVLLVFGLLLIVLFQDVLPPTAMGRWRLPIESVIALAYLTVLIAMTGGYQSPYFFGYVLLVGAAGLSAAGAWAVVLALGSSLSYLVAIGAAGNVATMTTQNLGQLIFNLIAIALVMYVASVVGREQRQAREAALSLSRFDSLTGLLTSRFFVIAVEQEILRATRSRRPFALIMVDMDGLHEINQRFGLEGGDEAIKATASAIQGAIRATDVVARNSGAADEFFVMLPETDVAGATLVAEAIRKEIGGIAISRSGGTLRCTASIGVVAFPEDAKTWTELKNRANLAEQEAKHRGGNGVILHRQLTAPSGSTHVARRSASAPRPADPRANALPPASPGPAPWETT